MSKIKYYLIFCGVVVLIASLLFGGCAKPAPAPTPAPAPAPTPAPAPAPAPKPQLTEIRLLGASQGTGIQAYFTILAKEWDKIPGVNAVAFTGSSVPNLIAMEEGKGEITFVSLPFAHDALAGTGKFQGRVISKMRHLWRWSESYYLFAVRADSDIHSIGDLKDKVILSGQKGSSTIIAADPILEAYGITEETIAKTGGIINRPGYADGAKMLQDKTADCQAFMCNPYGPHSMHLALEETVGLRLLPLDADKRDIVLNKVQGLTKAEYPGGLYKNEPNPVPCVKVVSSVVCSADVPDDVVYEMMVRAWEPGFVEEVRAAVAYIKGITFEAGLMAGSEVVPMHPGAEKFWKDKGLLK